MRPSRSSDPFANADLHLVRLVAGDRAGHFQIAHSEVVGSLLIVRGFVRKDRHGGTKTKGQFSIASDLVHHVFAERDALPGNIYRK